MTKYFDRIKELRRQGLSLEEGKRQAKKEGYKDPFRGYRVKYNRANREVA